MGHVTALAYALPLPILSLERGGLRVGRVTADTYGSSHRYMLGSLATSSLTARYDQEQEPVGSRG